MPELTDLSVIRALCEKYDFALSKGFGQNFIINPGLPPKIVDASGVDKRYGVIEIGPGIGVLTRELAKRAAKVLAAIPHDCALLETDCPYMAPEPVRGTRNDSRNIAHVADSIGTIWGMDAQAVLDITAANARKCFNL